MDMGVLDGKILEQSLEKRLLYPKCQKAVVLSNIGYIYQKNISKEGSDKEQMNRNLESILVLEKILMKKDLPDGYMDEVLRYFTFSIYDSLKYFPERTMQFAFLTACDMIQTISSETVRTLFRIV